MQEFINMAVDFNKPNMTREDMRFLQELGVMTICKHDNGEAHQVIKVKNKAGKEKTV